VPQGGSEDVREGFHDNTIEDVDVSHLRYVVAARGYLRG
jgi:hypothetical protein